MFVQRLISGAVLVVIMAACLIVGGDALWAFCMVAAVIGFYEMANATGVLTKETSLPFSKVTDISSLF